MPLHAEIYINSTYIEGLHIGRIKGNTKPDTINTYLVVNGPLPRTEEDWAKGVNFTHRYGDGALTCVRKAIEALENDGATF